ncbi:uncharacterized protein LOC131036200 isoform X2 [Cryptomeria japonica]|uniref:uncharacterized protein LOC131036200 isoform X2 n=1 Tax=Cryptomeria japonica TaxID=3369 RepID=UPI0027DA1C90|nr:uncharacterized protein LOC131036200 isoform X2 [Cryptomeria japonica]
MVPVKSMTWSRVLKSAQAVAAHGLLLCFTILLTLKLDKHLKRSWWFIFLPIWLFHIVVARGRFSLPAPSPPHDRHWAPCHAVAASPLLIAFELLLCTYLDSHYVYGIHIVNLKIVFLPLLIFEAIILIDNFRMCRALMPSDEESMTDEAIWETLPHFWVAVSMVFFIAATMFTLLKLSGDVGSLGWWDLFINYGIAECFAFLVCTKWSNPCIHREHQSGGASTSSINRQASSSENQYQDGICGLQNIGGHIMKVPVVAFQILLCMRLEGTPKAAQHIPAQVIFIPLFLVQGVAVLFSLSRFVEKIVLLLRSGNNTALAFRIFTKFRDTFGFLHHGSRLLGWWCIDEGSREEQARLLHAQGSGHLLSTHSYIGSYNTFSGFPPEVVKKMAKKELAEEVWRLQAALGEQAEITKYSQQEYDRLQNEKVLCRICFEGDIAVVLLPCRHRILCRRLSELIGYGILERSCNFSTNEFTRTLSVFCFKFYVNKVKYQEHS